MMRVARLCSLACLPMYVALNLACDTTLGAEGDVAATVRQRVRDWQPSKDERLLDLVGWASDLVDGQRLAKQHDRPLFVFTYSGSTTRANAIALQRC